MIYTRCNGTCPMITQDLQKIEKALPEKVKDRVRFALFSIDPSHESLPKLNDYAAAHHLDLTVWSVYRANNQTVRLLAAALDLKFKKESEGVFDHANLITLLDPEGKIVKQMTGVKQDSTRIISAIQ